MEVLVGLSGVSLSISLLLKILGKSDVKVTTVTHKEVPALSDGTVGVLEVARAIAVDHPILVEKEKKEVEKWLKFLTVDFLQTDPIKDSNRWIGRLHKLNKDLVTDVFFLGDELSIIDLAFFAVLHPIVRDWKEEERALFCNIVRWVDYLQHHDAIRNTPEFPLIAINKNIPEELPSPSVKDKKEVVGDEQKSVPQKQSKPEQKKEEKKGEKPEQGKKRQPKKQPDPKKPEGPVDVSRLDIRIGKILNVKMHESANTLYVEEIDVGEEKPRQVVSGLVNFIPIEEMKNRDVVVLCNLKPAKLRGVESQAMVLAASNADHTQVELLQPPPGCKIGERVTFENYEGNPDSPFLNPKQKLFEQIQPDFATTDDRVAVYKGTPFQTSSGIVTVKSITKGTIK